MAAVVDLRGRRGNHPRASHALREEGNTKQTYEGKQPAESLISPVIILKANDLIEIFRNGALVVLIASQQCHVTRLIPESLGDQPSYQISTYTQQHVEISVLLHWYFTEHCYYIITRHGGKKKKEEPIPLN